ncbi:MAG: OsmC family protein [Acidobacteria bacterium]|nr:OsmC family protein [Acidobacteriota bacterium]
METSYSYTVNGHWTGARTGSVSPEEITLPVFFSAPAEFGGEPGHWTPEHMLVAAVASCYLTTFSAMAQNSKLRFLDLELSVHGTLTKDPEGWRFTEFCIQPTITLENDADEDRAIRLMQKAERTCLIARSLSARVLLQPEIQAAEPDLIFAE